MPRSTVSFAREATTRRPSQRAGRLSSRGRSIPAVAITRRDFVRRSAAGAVLLGVGAARAEADRLPPSQVRALRDAVRGRVLTPSTHGYDAARVIFNRRYDGVRPPAVVRVQDAADVQAVVRWAERFDVPLTVRSGGHAYNGASTSRQRRGRRSAPPRPDHAARRHRDGRAGRAQHRRLRRARPPRRHDPLGLVPDGRDRRPGDRRRDGARRPRARAHDRPRAQLRRRDRRRAPPPRSTRARTRTCTGRCAAAAAASRSSPRCGCACAGCGARRGSASRSRRRRARRRWRRGTTSRRGRRTS